MRNGYHQLREVLTSAGPIEVTAPRVNGKRTDPDTGHRLPPWARKTPQVAEVLPLLYLHELPGGELSEVDYVYGRTASHVLPG